MNSNNTSVPEEYKVQNKEMKALFAEVFSTPLGQKVVKHLEKMTIEQNVLQSYQPDGFNTALEMARREGANQLVRQIKALVKGGSENE